MKHPLFASALATLILATASLAPSARATVVTDTAPVSFAGIDPGIVTMTVPGMDRDAGPLISMTFTITGMLQAVVSNGPVWTDGTAPMFTNSVQVEPFMAPLTLGTVAARSMSPSTMGENTWITFTGTLPVGYVATARGDGLDLSLFFEALLTGPGALSETIGFTGEIEERFTYGVPEPASLALVGAALLGAGLRARRQRR